MVAEPERQKVMTMDAPLPQDASGTDTRAAILDEVLARFGTTEDARLREIMLSLIPHLHAFVRETKLTWAEWERGMAFFATAARVTEPGRNEFIALSDSIGVACRCWPSRSRSQRARRFRP